MSAKFLNTFPKKPTPLHLALILAGLALLTRFWKLSAIFHWTLDEEYWAYIAHNIATLVHIPLIGGPASGTGLYLGPFYVWFLAPFFALFKSHPFGIAVFVSSLGVITSVLIFKLFIELQKSKSLHFSAPFLAALLYSTSTLAIIYDRKFWNATPIPFLSLIVLYLLHRLFKQPSLKLTLSLALALSFAFHAHMTGAVLIVFTFISWFIHKLPKNLFIKFFIALIILQAPLYLFELRHNFTNTRALASLFSSHANSNASSSLNLAPRPAKLYLPIRQVQQSGEVSNLILTTYSRLIYTPAIDISKELTLCADYAHTRSIPSPGVTIIAGLVLIYSLRKLKQKSPFAILLWTNIGLLVAFRLLAPADTLYPGLLSEYYLLPSFISFLFLAAQLSVSAYKRFPTLITTLIMFLIIINLHTTLNLTHSQGFARRDRLVKLALNHLGNKPFALDVSGDRCQIYGYRYLFTVYNREPSTSYLDPNFSWIYQKYTDPRQSEISLTLYPETDRIQLDQHEAAH